MPFSPFIESLCPSCIRGFYLGDCEIVSTLVPGKILRPAVKEGPERLFARMRPASLTGPIYTKELARRKCPHCGYLLPYNIELVPSVRIVVVGDHSSGKSYYIAALMRQLEDGRWMTREQYTNVSCLSQEVERAYDRFYELALLKSENKPSHGTISPPSATDPVIYELSLSSSPRHRPQRFNILLYDVPSSNHLSAEDREWFSRCLLHASAMIFLIAPENLPAIASSLPSSLRLLRQEEAYYLLQSTLHLLGQRGHFREGRRASHFPLAVTVSKSDLLRYVHSINADFLVSRDCAYDNETSLGDIEAIDREVRELLIASGNKSFISVTQEIPRVKFFAVSAIGHSVNTQGKFSDAEPCRCLDPILWIFHELDIISELKRE